MSGNTPENSSAGRCSVPVIGLVGGIGSGKSLVARQLADLGCAVIDADELARQALDEPPVVRKIAEWWGDDVLSPDGRPNRAALARLVFGSRELLDRLEQLVHPIVHARRRVLRERFEVDPAVRAIVEDCPLLLEKGLDAECDVVIFVKAQEAVRYQRLASERQWSADDVRRREKNQLPLDIKAGRADHIVDNDASEDDCLSHVRRVLSQILTKHAM